MKLLISAALLAITAPLFATGASARDDSGPRERRVCTQINVRAGSHMSGRRICRTSAEWREALGPDWRQRLAGFTGTQDDFDSLTARTPASWDGSGGVRPQASHGGLSPH